MDGDRAPEHHRPKRTARSPWGLAGASPGAVRASLLQWDGDVPSRFAGSGYPAPRSAPVPLHAYLSVMGMLLNITSSNLARAASADEASA